MKEALNQLRLHLVKKNDKESIKKYVMLTRNQSSNLALSIGERVSHPIHQHF
jgi:hypothetical protein